MVYVSRNVKKGIKRAKNVYYGIKGYNPGMSQIYKSILAYSISDEAKFRMEVLIILINLV